MGQGLYETLETMFGRRPDGHTRQAVIDALWAWNEAEKKHGAHDNDDFVWSAVLAEETGEVASAALAEKFGGDGDLDAELAQVAGVAMAWLAWRKRRRG